MPDSHHVATDDVARRIAARVGTPIGIDVVARLAAYLALLARWNRRMNLTALDVETPSDAAIDRLIAEPLEAVALVAASDRTALDVGSGAGSPALPLKIAAPALQMTLVEARAKKCAFLREAVRVLELDGADVFTGTLNAYVASAGGRRADIVTLRGVRGDAALWRDVMATLLPSGRVFWFGGDRAAASQPSGLIFDAPARSLVVGRVAPPGA